MDLLGNAAPGALLKFLPHVLLAITIFIFLFDLVRNRVWAGLEPQRVTIHLKALVATLLSGAAVLALCAVTGLHLENSAPYYAAGLAITYVLADLTLKPAMRTMLQLACAVILTMIVPTDALAVPASSYLFGALSIRLVLNMLKPKDARLDDVAPPFVYLAGIVFAATGAAGSGRGEKIVGMINSAFIISSLMTLMQRPFMHDDKILVKRLVLVLSGGLAYLVLVTKAVNAPEYVRMAALVGAGYGMAYALDALAVKKDCATSAIKQILTIGIFTLLASRLYGNLGICALGAGCMVGHFTQIPAAAAIFFGARIFEQAFAFDHVSNVTGVNMNHPYVSAAVYLGMFTAIALMALLKDVGDRRVMAATMAVVAAASSCAVGYFLHSEAAGGYLISLIISSVMVAIVGQSFFPEEEEKPVSIVLVAALAVTCAVMSSDMLAFGVASTIEERLYVLGGIAAVTFIALLLGYLKGRKNTVVAEEPTASV